MKLLCLIEDNEFLIHDLYAHPLRSLMVHSDCAYMKVLEFPHEEMEKNRLSITLNGEHFCYMYRATDGNLYYISEWYSRMNLINLME